MAGKRKVYDESMRMAANSSWDRDWGNALKAYRAALQEFPDDTDAVIGLATAYTELKQYESAIRALQKVLKSDSSNQKALHKMGETLAAMGRLEDAAKTYLYAGNLQAKANNLQNAVESWDKAVSANPNQLQARNNLAQAYVKQRQLDRAVPELVALAALYQDRGDDGKAGQYLKGALRLMPNGQLVQAALRALENGVSIRTAQQEKAPLPIVEDSIAESPIKVIEEAPYSSSDEEMWLLDLEADEEEQSPANPREKIQQLAMEEMANTLFDDAAEYTSLSVDKSEIDLLIGQAIDQQTRGNTTQAIAAYKDIIQAGFDRPAAYFVLGTLYMQDAQYNKAITYLQQASQEDSYALGVHFALGECLKGQNKNSQALKHFIEALRAMDLKNAHQDNTHEFNQLYETYAAVRDDTKTAAFIDAIINFLSSRNYERKIAEVRRSLSDGNGAFINSLIEFIEAKNTDAILMAMANTNEYMRQNLFLTAVEACYLAIQQSPSYLPLHIRLAEIYMKQEMIDKSIQKYLVVAEVYNTRDNLEQVTSIYQRILKVAPMDITVRSKLVDMYISQNNIDAALAEYQVLADAYYQLAQINKSITKYKEAFRLAAKSSTSKQWQIEILRRLGDIYEQRVDWVNAAEVYERLVQLSPEDDSALLSLVDLRFKLGETTKAIETLDKVTALYEQQGRQGEMLQFLEDMTQLRPNELFLRERLADSYIRQNMNREALKQYDFLGEMQLDAGLRDDAARTIQRIIDLGPDDPEGYKQLLAQLKGNI